MPERVDDHAPAAPEAAVQDSAAAPASSLAGLAAPSADMSVEQLLGLQQTAGNSAINGFMKRAGGRGGSGVMDLGAGAAGGGDSAIAAAIAAEAAARRESGTMPAQGLANGGGANGAALGPRRLPRLAVARRRANGASLGGGRRNGTLRRGCGGRGGRR